MSRGRILIVDDEAGMLRTVERVLAPIYEVHAARTPSQGLALAALAPPELAVLDVRMPEMDGFELMARLQEAHPGLDVILMTGSTDERDARLVRAIREKAFFFLTKPFDRDVLLTLVERCMDLRRLDAENRAQMARLEQELDAAREFQWRLLPKPEVARSGFALAVHYEPTAELCGDFYDYAYDGRGVTVLIADVAGHGVRAAMLTGMVKLAFHAAADEAYAPVAVLRHVAESMRLAPRDHHLTLACVRLDSGRGRAEIVSAGHPPVLIIRREGTRSWVSATTFVLHPRLPSPIEETVSVDLAAGDRLVLYTDGLTEARNAAEEEYGAERLERAAVAATATVATGKPGELLAAIRDDLRAFTGGRPLADDLAILVLEARS